MYIPKKFLIEEATEIKNFLHNNTFGAFISHVDERITACHIPWHLVETEAGEWLMQAHVARANPQWKALEASPAVMLMFQGAHTYVTSSWYSVESAPTWNYQAVHLYGQARIVSEAELEQMLACLMENYESKMPQPLRYEDISEKTRTSFLQAIVGIEVNITEVQAKYKLSQNRNALDFQHIIDQLEKMPDPQAHGVAHEMKKIKNKN